ncbi:MAG: hypothetical protein P857_357 [Candidatus Xenolissoclinum pacificiensis L6]|uniref:Uncharacterized protein n=1 Tax=Candidatus Xenolissoclinum pacificiensis L6 TaxID=1401685 RepID=W2V1A1_9RICK|nr:MAG: hypothetical protein P857_357 [Candidatus Xenolissoclinum pacificiensis L6]
MYINNIYVFGLLSIDSILLDLSDCNTSLTKDVLSSMFL